MNTTKISFLLDILFYFFVIFFVSIIWLRFYIHSSWSVITLATLISLLFSLIILRIKLIKKQKKSHTNSELKLAKNFSLEMLYLTEKEQCEKICTMLNISKSYIKKKSIINKNYAIKPLYTNFSINKIDIIKTISQLKDEKIEKIIILCANYSPECFNFENQINDIKISILNENEVYEKLLKTLNYKSEIKSVPKPTRKEHFKNLLSVAFNNKRTKGYFCSAFILFLCSLVFRYNLYYIIVSSLLFIFALISKFNKVYNKKEVNNIDFNQQKT